MKFTETHEWIKKEGENKGIVGITKYAQEELGEIVYIELPEVGTRVKAGEEICVLESTKAAADIYSPVSGRVVAVNEALRENPSLLNQKPEKDGWLFKMEFSNPDELFELLDLAEYESLTC